jgi:D-glycero-D-manno-heptose 1,7-bisphosphate phosphatase
MNPGAFLDRDGTINMDAGYVASPDKLEFTPGAVEAILALNRRGYRVAVITNQAGVARGFHTEADVDVFHAEMSRQLALAGAHIDRFYHCPHHVDGTVEPYNVRCDCRKPGDAMYRQAISDLDLDPARCIAIGDKPTDLIPAITLGAAAVLLVPQNHIDHPSPEEQQFSRAENLQLAVEQLLA